MRQLALAAPRIGIDAPRAGTSVTLQPTRVAIECVGRARKRIVRRQHVPSQACARVCVVSARERCRLGSSAAHLAKQRHSRSAENPKCVSTEHRASGDASSSKLQAPKRRSSFHTFRHRESSICLA